VVYKRAQLSDGHFYEVRHTIDAGFKARSDQSVLWTDGNPMLAGALREAYEGTLDSEAERVIDDTAASMMELGFTNIPDDHHGQRPPDS
jgi:hypothetical protein